MDCQDRCANGIQDMMAHMMLMSVTAEEIHGDGIGMINGKNIKKTALKWRQKMEEAPRHLCPNDLSDEAFIESLGRALWKKGKSIDIKGDSYIVIE